MELLIDEVDLTGFDLVYATLADAEAKTYAVDVPGGGSIDLTEFGGDVAYQQRKLDALLVCRRGTHAQVTEDVARLASVLDGRRRSFTISERPGLTFTGRFSFGTTDEEGWCLRAFHITADVDPYGDGGLHTWRVNAAGGIVVDLPNGRKRTRPTIEVSRETLVDFEGSSWTLEPGSHVITDLWLHDGTNRLRVNTYPGYSYAALSDYASDALSKHASEMMSALSAGSKPLQSPDLLSDHASDVLMAIGTKPLMELSHKASTGDEDAAYFQYRTYDL